MASLVAGMVAGADSIDDMALLRQWGMGRVFAWRTPCRRWGRSCGRLTFGHVRQLDAVAARFYCAGRSAQAAATTTGRRATWRGSTTRSTWTTPSSRSTATPNQGAGFGYSGCGLNAADRHPDHTRVCSVGRGRNDCASGALRVAARCAPFVGDAVKQTRCLLGEHAPVLRDVDLAYYGRRGSPSTPRSPAARQAGHRPSGPGHQGRDRFNP